GHACREEQKLMLNICSPKMFMPIHGEYRMLVGHAELAVECGVARDKVFVLDNGDVLEIDGVSETGAITGKVESGIRLVDSNREWMIDEDIVEERHQLSEDGLVSVLVAAGPDVSIRGIILPQDLPAEEFVIQVESQIREYFRRLKGKQESLESSLLQSYLIAYFEKEMRTRPLVLVKLHRLSIDKSQSQSSKKTASSKRSSLKGDEA
ncbi:MAG TPA: MBL fold metallo-hydrolase RNA specificity domain-containing protein, partial [Candidatus Melainabacteria bacterium]|nr:MBL fold metallo-hydrolase RNA specificity domain-containing protein [Candidatus Melainabacteria bacterium]